MIERHYSLKHADNVLKFVKRLARGTKMKFGLEVWSNGRMQGYFLDRTDGNPNEWPGVVWAQYKTSDSTIVIFGRTCQFDVTTHMPNEELWQEEHQKFFPYDKDEEAAKFIVDYLTYYPLKELKRAAQGT